MFPSNLLLLLLCFTHHLVIIFLIFLLKDPDIQRTDTQDFLYRVLIILLGSLFNFTHPLITNLVGFCTTLQEELTYIHRLWYIEPPSLPRGPQRIGNIPGPPMRHRIPDPESYRILRVDVACPVCFNNNVQLMSTQCGHLICRNCWPYVRQDICPTCRQPVLQEPHNIYL